ncbi:MAG: hypothetical protein IPM60_13195 [Rhodospirillales bacterium]|nr:hypothetical protein [Rhodospirillales bacterium]
MFRYRDSARTAADADAELRRAWGADYEAKLKVAASAIKRRPRAAERFLEDGSLVAVPDRPGVYEVRRRPARRRLSTGRAQPARARLMALRSGFNAARQLVPRGVSDMSSTLPAVLTGARRPPAINKPLMPSPVVPPAVAVVAPRVPMPMPSPVMDLIRPKVEEAKPAEQGRPGVMSGLGQYGAKYTRRYGG